MPADYNPVGWFEIPVADLARAEERGGRTLVPKMSIGEYGYVGFLQDCEGNRIGLHSRNG